jgi:hypothetical protein
MRYIALTTLRETLNFSTVILAVIGQHYFNNKEVTHFRYTSDMLVYFLLTMFLSFLIVCIVYDIQLLSTGANCYMFPCAVCNAVQAVASKDLS